MRKTLIILFFISYNYCHAQNIPLDQQVQKRFNEMTLSADTSIFTAFRSIDWLELKHILSPYKTQLTDSAFGLSAGDTSGYFFRHITTNNWIQANGHNSVFAIDPYFDASFGKEKEQTSSIYQLSAGFHLQGTVNDKLSYSLAYVYTNERFPNYIDSFIANKQVPNSSMGYVPGMGKGTLNSDGSYGFSQITGNVTYMPNSHFLVSVGNGKNFIGDGYRSLMLSDNASNYPFVRLQAKYWKLTYNVIYSEMDNPRYLVDGTDQRKYNFMHFLGINFSDRFQMGVFDDVIFYAKDTTIHRGFDVNYINPIIFIRPEEYAIGSPDNSSLGLTAKYKLHKKGYLYGQLFIDDLHIAQSTQTHTNFWANKYAVQLGIFNKDVFTVKGLTWRLEFNSVRPYTYDHGFDKPGINYTHVNQALADPFGANFNEFISIFQYNSKRWYGSLENLLTIRGEQPAGQTYPNGQDLWGGDPDVRDANGQLPNVVGSKTMQGVKNNYLYNQLKIGYLINPRNRLGIEANAVYRHQSAPGVAVSDVFFSIGIKTGLYNFYKDF